LNADLPLLEWGVKLYSLPLPSFAAIKRNSQSTADKYRRKYAEPGRQILIMYGTEYGFSKELARELFDR